uniref:Uncharacterized protein n=1 Tax=Hyaloperonospora arabidopsidis (strain Emoy2) TaxID=559515 RepID=M4BLX2_HYAAE
MPIIVLLIGDGISAKLPCKPVAGIHLHDVPSSKVVPRDFTYTRRAEGDFNTRKG